MYVKTHRINANTTGSNGRIIRNSLRLGVKVAPGFQSSMQQCAS